VYESTLSKLRQRGRFVSPVTSSTSPSVDRGTIELFAHSFTLLNPRTRVFVCGPRPLNIVFPFGAFLYLLSGRDDVPSIEYYNPEAMRFSDNGTTLHGSYGPRIVRPLSSLIRLLRDDPMTRRAVLTIFESERDLVSSRDVPCPIAVQFLARKGVLDAVVTFRSQNALMVFPYDLMLFTLLHEYVAVMAGLELGAYVQHTGSMHIYESEVALATEVETVGVDSVMMLPMQRLTDDAFAIVMDFEERARRVGTGVAFEQLTIPRGLSPFWESLCAFLMHFAVSRTLGHRHMRDVNVFARFFAYNATP
jgi:thymidylate synthase